MTWRVQLKALLGKIWWILMVEKGDFCLFFIVLLYFSLIKLILF